MLIRKRYINTWIERIDCVRGERTVSDDLSPRACEVGDQMEAAVGRGGRRRCRHRGRGYVLGSWTGEREEWVWVWGQAGTPLGAWWSSS